MHAARQAIVRGFSSSPEVSEFYELARLGKLAQAIGISTERLLAMDAERVNRWLAVQEGFDRGHEN